MNNEHWAFHLLYFFDILQKQVSWTLVKATLKAQKVQTETE